MLASLHDSADNGGLGSEVELKDIDGQRSVFIDFRDDMPGHLWLTGPNGLCMEFDVGIVVHRIRQILDMVAA